MTTSIEKQGLSVTEACAVLASAKPNSTKRSALANLGPKIWQAHNRFAGRSIALPGRAPGDERFL